MNTSRNSASTPSADRWWVQVDLGETDGTSTASATLHTRDRATLHGHGTARLDPHDRDVPEIGYELATARALSDLAHHVLEAAADDITGVTRDPVTPGSLARDPATR